MKTILALTALLFFSTGAAAQTVVFEDDFEDSVIHPMWTVDFDQLAFWTVFEGAGNFQYLNLTTPFGANDERYTLTANVPNGLPGTFQVDADMRWNDQQGSPQGQDHMVFVISLLDSAGVEIASFRRDDVSNSHGGIISVIGNNANTFPGLPADTSSDVSLWRDSSNVVHYSLDVVGRPSATGSLGVVNGIVDKVTFYASHTAGGGGSGSPMGQMFLDSIRIWDAPTTITLATAGLFPGAPANFNMTLATPNRPVILGFSLAGNGPTNTPFGVADLSTPIQNFAPVMADSNGDATVVVNVPAGGSGITVWFQAVDQASGTLSNSLAETVL